MTLPESRTKILIENLRNDDSSAFSELYTAHFSSTYRFCHKFLRSRELAEECAQMTFVKLWDVRHQLNCDLNFRSYLFTIAKNTVLKTIEKAARDRSLKEKVLMDYEREEVGDLVEEEDLEAIAMKALENLPPQRQVVFRLCKVEGRSYEEAAVMLGISQGTVRDHLFKATKSIRKYLSIHRVIGILAVACAHLLF